MNISRLSPVAADELNSLTIISGTMLAGIPIFPHTPLKSPAIKSRNPEALNTPTATISPISVGAIETTVLIPSSAPFTKYAGRTYKNYALVAGFNEAGETIEQTVRREVMEEVGLKVKNLKYYKSQPWGLSGSLLSGFFCELDGDDKITLQEDELSLGTWVKADDLDLEDDGISLTREMILKFKKEHSIVPSN